MVKKEIKASSGFTLIEALVTVAIFTVFAFVVYLAYSNISDAMVRNRLYAAAISIVENEIEIVRNMDYADVGISGGYPSGKIAAEKSVSFENFNFTINAVVRNIDDAFDGIAGGVPQDTAPADYKLVEFTISCSNCRPKFNQVEITATVAPRSLETTTNNGSLFVNVFDAYGQPVVGADVLVVNNSLNPTINIEDSTNNNGVLQLVDIPTSTAAYEISVSKQGYSSDKTYQFGAPENPNPAKPHATVASQLVTSISFAIDRTSSVDLKTANSMCVVSPNVEFSASGTKLIGTAPDVLKYSASSTTGVSGQKIISNLEWDAYNFSNLDDVFDLAGYSPLLPIIIDPNTAIKMSWLMEQKNPSALLVTVSSGGALINDVSVRLIKTGFDETFYTKRRYFSQTDWSGGQYDSQSGGIADNNPSGEIKMIQTDGKYSTTTEEWLVSSTFDLGTSSVSFYNLSWGPTNQPVQTGSDSLKIQIASNNDNSAWNFVGPDGTGNSFYASSTVQLHSSHNNNRYLRYRVLMKTADENFTPSLEDLKVEFSSGCLTDGQAFFSGLANGDYTIVVSKNGYQEFSDAGVSISENWQEYKAELMAQ